MDDLDCGSSDFDCDSCDCFSDEDLALCCCCFSTPKAEDDASKAEADDDASKEDLEFCCCCFSTSKADDDERTNSRRASSGRPCYCCCCRQHHTRRSPKEKKKKKWKFNKFLKHVCCCWLCYSSRPESPEPSTNPRPSPHHQRPAMEQLANIPPMDYHVDGRRYPMSLEMYGPPIKGKYGRDDRYPVREEMYGHGRRDYGYGRDGTYPMPQENYGPPKAYQGMVRTPY